MWLYQSNPRFLFKYVYKLEVEVARRFKRNAQKGYWTLHALIQATICCCIKVASPSSHVAKNYKLVTSFPVCRVDLTLPCISLEGVKLAPRLDAKRLQDVQNLGDHDGTCIMWIFARYCHRFWCGCRYVRCEGIVCPWGIQEPYSCLLYTSPSPRD